MHGGQSIGIGETPLIGFQMLSLGVRENWPCGITYEHKLNDEFFFMQGNDLFNILFIN